MDVWTEVVTEDIADVHVGDQHVLVPLAEDVEERDVRQVMDVIRARNAWEYQLREMRELNDELEKQKRVRERLKGTEYEGML